MDDANERGDAAGDVELELESSDEGESLLDLLLAEHGAPSAEAPAPRIEGVVVGALAAFDASGAPRVTFPGGPEGGLAARAMTALGPEDVGREVALLFEAGDPSRPVVMGRMHASAEARPTATADGKSIEIRAEKEIVLACGKASITLTRAGKILIRGEYVLSRSSGVHRIQGGSVQIN